MQTSNPPEVSSRNWPDRPMARNYTRLQSLFLLRFEKLLDKRQQYVGRIKPEDWRVRLLDKALYSTYRDCVALDVGDQARGLRRECEQSSYAR